MLKNRLIKELTSIGKKTPRIEKVLDLLLRPRKKDIIIIKTNGATPMTYTLGEKGVYQIKKESDIFYVSYLNGVTLEVRNAATVAYSFLNEEDYKSLTKNLVEGLYD